MDAGYVVAHLAEIAGVPDPEPDDPEWKPIRHHFGIRAFGVNAFVAPDSGRRLSPEHDETASGHEELYLVIEGRATFTVAGRELDCPAGTLLFVPPGTVRKAASAEPNTTLLAVAGIPGQPYEISPWEAKWTTGLPHA